MTFVETCNPSDPLQQWTFVGPAGATVLKNVATGNCIDASAQSDPVQIVVCNPASASQHWVLDAAGHIFNNATSKCLDVDNFNVSVGWSCEPDLCCCPPDNPSLPTLVGP